MRNQLAGLMDPTLLGSFVDATRLFAHVRFNVKGESFIPQTSYNRLESFIGVPDLWTTYSHPTSIKPAPKASCNEYRPVYMTRTGEGFHRIQLFHDFMKRTGPLEILEGWRKGEKDGVGVSGQDSATIKKNIQVKE